MIGRKPYFLEYWILIGRKGLNSRIMDSDWWKIEFRDFWILIGQKVTNSESWIMIGRKPKIVEFWKTGSRFGEIPDFEFLFFSKSQSWNFILIYWRLNLQENSLYRA